MCETKCESFLKHINGWPVWCEKIGCGPKPLLMIPGAIGTGRTDFWPQLEGEDALDLQEFTIIAVEAPGWGRSRPPVRKYNANMYYNDVQCLHELMRSLGFEKYSIIGWSYGAKVALLMAIRYSQSIQSLVLISISTHITESALKFIQKTKNVQNWGKDKIDCYLRSYETKDEIQELWTKFSKFLEYHNQYFPEDINHNKYHLIECPVLVLHGERDQMIDSSQPLHVCKHITNSKLHRFPTGAHDIHLKYPIAFKRLAEEHLLNDRMQA